MATNKTLKPTKSETTSGAFIQRIILAGTTISDTDLADVVRKFFPERTTTAKDVQWNRWRLRQDGKLAAPAKKTAKKAAKKSAAKKANGKKRASAEPNKKALQDALKSKLDAAAPAGNA